MRGVKAAGPCVENDGAVAAGGLFVEILRKLLRALNAVLLFGSLDGERDARIVKGLVVRRLEGAARAVQVPSLIRGPVFDLRKGIVICVFKLHKPLTCSFITGRIFMQNLLNNYEQYF